MGKRLRLGFILWLLTVLVLKTDILAAGDDSVTDNNLFEVVVDSNMRKSPSAEGKVITIVPEGSIVILLKEDSNGYSLVDHNGTQGYIYTSCLKQADSEEARRILERVENQRSEAVEAVNDKRGDGSGDRSSRDSLLANMLQTPGTSEESASAENEEIELSITSNVNFRKIASENGERLRLIQAGSRVIFLDAGENGFYHVDYRGERGYVYSKCVDSEELLKRNLVQKRSDGCYIATAAGEGAGRSSRSSTDTMLFSQAGLMGSGGGSRVTSAASSLVEEGDAGAEEKASSGLSNSELSALAKEVQGREKATPQIQYQIGVKSNLRSTPGEEADLLADLPSGASVLVLGKKDGYTMVEYNGLTGYVLTDHVVDQVDFAKLNGKAVLFTITAYCPCRICCGDYSYEVTGKEPCTATGTVPVAGRTIAVDPSVIPYGSHVNIEGMGTYIAEDCGGAVNDNHIDVYFNTHEEAIQFGVKKLYVTVEP